MQKCIALFKIGLGMQYVGSNMRDLISGVMLQGREQETNSTTVFDLVRGSPTLGLWTGTGPWPLNDWAAETDI